VPEVLRYAAFTDRPDGGNPAGVVLEAGGMSDAEMLAVAADVGYSETAFRDGETLRYFSAVAEVPFCGHATIATGVALGDGDWRFATRNGLVEVEVREGVATLTSVPPRVEDPRPGDVEEALAALGWAAEDLDPALPPRVGFAGAHHLILGIASRERLAELDYDFERLRALCARRDWTTVALVHRRAPLVFDARNPFPAGGVVEDPATGAAAAALGAYLRALRLVAPPAEVTIHQGDDLGRPSLLRVEIPVGERSGIRVGGRAVPIS
jgi:PhzF family phenazine biosynthesis protein